MVIDTVLFKLFQVPEPLFLNLLIFEVVLFLRVDAITVLDDYTETILIFLVFNDQPFHILNLKRDFTFLFSED